MYLPGSVAAGVSSTQIFERTPHHVLDDHELEVCAPDFELCLADEPVVIFRLSSGIIPTEHVSLVGLVVIRVDAVESADLVRREAG